MSKTRKRHLCCILYLVYAKQRNAVFLCVKTILFLKLFVLVVQFYQKGKIDLNFNYFVIVHTKQFLSLFSYFREIICLFALLQFRVKESAKNFYNLIGLVGLY